MRKILLALIILAAIIIYGCSSGPGKYDSFAQCLSDSGAMMFGTEWCSHCKNQKKAFGKSFDYIDYVDCDKYRDECLRNGVKSYPTWKINGSNYIGEQNFYRLSTLSGCEINEESNI